MNINQHVVKRERGWAVLGEGNQRDTVVLATQAAAIDRARRIARNRGSQMIVHTCSGGKSRARRAQAIYGKRRGCVFNATSHAS